MAPASARRLKRRVEPTLDNSATAPVEDDGVPQVYKDMLLEEVANGTIPDNRSIKRRRVGERSAKFEDSVKDEDNVSEQAESVGRTQIIEDLDQESDEEEFEWEEVDTLGITDLSVPEQRVGGEEQLSIVISEPSNGISTKAAKRRVKKPITATEKQIRLDVHKAHLLCLLFHVYQRNHWCNDSALQRYMRKLLKISPKIVQKLHPTVSASQFQRSNWLKEALNELTEIWRARFSITRRGQRRASWNPSAEVSPTFYESILDPQDFREKAHSLDGSADYGAQLFCALLRGLGLDTRLVCSLQPLPFATSAATVSPARIASIPTVYAMDSEDDLPSPEMTDTSPKPKARRIARLGKGQRTCTTDLGVAPESVSQRSRPATRPRHPIFWVEVFDASYQNWITVDPLATGNVGKSMSLEPGMNDPENLLSYVVAFEDDNTVRDVTRRYTKAYNAKTRKLRVECTDNGIKWYTKALRLFRRRKKLDRDVLEDAYFTQRDIQEGMPRNVEDFRGHPVYVLERHLYRDEALHPKHEVGKVASSVKAATLSNMESVYRRQDVHLVKSADKWFRQGRRLKADEQPLKFVKARKRQELFEDADSDQTTAQSTLGLYAHFQTELYIPPSVTTDGLLPRNEFGNLDIYTRSMIPAGAVHVKSPYAAQAARILGIDYVDAVTGFNFKGRRGTAVVNGVVIASNFRDAIETTLESISYTRETEMAKARMDRVLALWRKFVLGLRIVESVKQYKSAHEETDDDDEDDEEYVGQNSAVKQQLPMKERLDVGNFDEEFGATSMLPEVAPFEIVESIHKIDMPTTSALRQMKLDSVSPHNLADNGRVDHAALPESVTSKSPSRRDTIDETGAVFEPVHEMEDHDQAGGFIIEDDSQLAIGLPLHANAKSPMHEIVPDAPAPQISDAEEPIREPEADINDDVDMHSLLSHDPDDDELEPGWLD